MTKRTLIIGGLGAAAISALAIPTTREALVNFVTNRPSATAQAQDAQDASANAANTDTAARETTKTTALPVAAIITKRAPFIQTIRATGRAEAPRRVELSARVSERITSVNVTEGDHVTRGATLVTLDARPFEIARREAESQRVTAEADNRVTLLDDDTADSTRRALSKHRSGLTQAEQAVERAELDLEGTTITAPFSGEIARVDAVTGAQAQAGQPLVTLVDLEEIRIPAEVLESDFGPLVPGAAARVRVAAFPDEIFTGTVIALGPELDADRGTGIAYISIENPDRRVRPGMYAEVEIESARHDDRLAVPRRAVLERDRKLLVFRASNGRAEWQYVETGLESATSIEITQGLAPGDTVLVDGHLTLAHAAPIRAKIVEE